MRRERSASASGGSNSMVSPSLNLPTNRSSMAVVVPSAASAIPPTAMSSFPIHSGSVSSADVTDRNMNRTPRLTAAPARGDATVLTVVAGTSRCASARATGRARCTSSCWITVRSEARLTPSLRASAVTSAVGLTSARRRRLATARARRCRSARRRGAGGPVAELVSRRQRAGSRSQGRAGRSYGGRCRRGGRGGGC